MLHMPIAKPFSPANTYFWEPLGWEIRNRRCSHPLGAIFTNHHIFQLHSGFPHCKLVFFHCHGGLIGFGPETQPKMFFDINIIWLRPGKSMLVPAAFLTASQFTHFQSRSGSRHRSHATGSHFPLFSHQLYHAIPCPLLPCAACCLPSAAFRPLPQSPSSPPTVASFLILPRADPLLSSKSVASFFKSS